MSQIKRMWAHYLALAIVIVILILPIFRIYTGIKFRFGIETANLSLTGLVMLVLVLAVRGAVHTYYIHRVVREQVDASQKKHVHKPLLLKILDMDLCCPMERVPDPEPAGGAADPDEISVPLNHPHGRRRRKRSRFPYEKIQKAVLTWEKRDIFFPANTLEEFLEEEFGCGPDGVSLMPTSSFYDYRRQVLEERERQKQHQ
ncbi:MAG: hypothetical protein HY869_08890 [Chloroflexi bacterium]|nr:hypothetical protein [Chloroflexota bacterium]